MGKQARPYKSEKRRKELSRQKRQEEKRQRRFSKGVSAEKDTELIDSGDKDKALQD